MVLEKTSEDEADQAALARRFSRNECILRFLSFLCMAMMFGLFLIQVDILWRARQSFLLDLLIPETPERYYIHPAFSDVPHSDDTWSWDPDTLILKVNTSFYVH